MAAACEFFRKENYLCIGNENTPTKPPGDPAMQTFTGAVTNHLGTALVKTITVICNELTKTQLLGVFLKEKNLSNITFKN